MKATYRVAGLFAGIGGIELGLSQAGHHAEVLIENDEAASAVLRGRFPAVPLLGDIRSVDRLPAVDVVAGGFPCQDLSQAGRSAGISGARSGLVFEVFRLLRTAPSLPAWLLLENVSFMLHLDGGRAMESVTSGIEGLGMRWAYRVVDSRAFGLPHRRQRVILAASASHYPAPLLLGDEAGVPTEPDYRAVANGFYWTEGLKGLGWAVDAVPTLKGGSTIGIASPPAIWMPDGAVRLPDIRDGERLQGFPADWTEPSHAVNRKPGTRWKLVGNAVSVPVAAWVGDRLSEPPASVGVPEVPWPKSGKWPKAASGGPGRGRVAYDASAWPVARPRIPLASFLSFPARDLSEKAANGFLDRASRSTLTFPPGLIDALSNQRARMREDVNQRHMVGRLV